MNLKQRIEDKYKTSIKEKDSNSINTLRLIKSAIKDKEIYLRTKQTEIDDKQILELLQSLIKQRKDSIDAFSKANREDLIQKEKNEINIIEFFLPQQLSENEINEIIIKIVNENNLISMKDMGKLMAEIKSNYAGQIDMALVGKIAKSILSN
tara:strand:- start:273 stop:728 length:456 start_codon:yes stop_codon:yes gene_type:complete